MESIEQKNVKSLNEENYEPEKNFNICKELSKQIYGNILPLKIETNNEIWDLIPTDKIFSFKPFTEHNFTCAAYKKKDEIIITFRGTDEIKDIIVDLNFLIKRIPEETVRYARNFYINIKANNPNCKIWLTGHSLGGAYAQILSYQYLKEKDNALGRSITFNAPGIHYEIHSGEDEIEAELKKLVSNYVIMNDYVGNFGTHIGYIYYFQPHPLDEYYLDATPDNKGNRNKRETAHHCILAYNEKDFGIRYSQTELIGFGRLNAWALWLFDIKNNNHDEQKIKAGLKLDKKINKDRLEEAICIINNSNIKIKNQFDYMLDGIPYNNPYSKE